MAGITDINYNRLIRWLVPPRLRRPTTLAWLKALNKPILDAYKRFKAWEQESWFYLKFQTGQVAHLEYVLNEKFDPAQKRIYISGGSQASRLYIHTDAELQPEWLYTDAENSPLYIFTDQELVTGWTNDFTINVPNGLVAEDATIKAFADRFKRDGKSYNYVKF